MFEIYLPIANLTVNGLEVILLGLLVGFLSGLFGVGGGFLMTPMLNIIFGIPMNVAVGSDLTQITATASSGAIAHRRMGNVEVRLALLILAGSVFGVQVGVQLVNILKTRGLSDLIIKEIYVVMLSIVSFILIAEGWKARGNARKAIANGGEHVRDKIEFGLGTRIQNIKFMSMHLHKAEVSIPVFIPPLIGFVVGLLAGIMGVGGGFIMIPSLIYILGIPTLVAIGTDLFQMVITAASGSIGHALSGNVDLYLVLLILAGSTIGAQLGAKASRKVSGEKLRLIFGFMVLAVAVQLLHSVLKTSYL